MAASDAAARRWVDPGTSRTNDTGGPAATRLTDTSPTGQAPERAIRARRPQLAVDERQRERARPAVPVPLKMTDQTPEAAEASGHRDEARVVDTPHRDLHLGHRRSLAAVGTVPLPRTLIPMKATTGDLPVGEDWTYEVKWDGMRALCFVDGDHLRVQSYNERDVTVSWPDLAGLPDALPAATALLDGELVATDGDGRPSFGLLQQRMHLTDPAEVGRRSAEVPVSYVAFDLLHLDGHDLTGLPLTDRRGLLDQVLDPGPRWRCSPLHDDGVALLEATKERGLEGVVAKRLGSRYEPGKRTRTWLKVKVRLRQEMVVGGWLPGEGNRSGRLGALLVGYHAEAGDGLLRFAGRVGTGFKDAELDAASAGCSRTWPPTSAPSTRRRPARRSGVGPAGSAPSWWRSSSSASGPPTTAYGIPATSGCEPTSPPRR